MNITNAKAAKKAARSLEKFMHKSGVALAHGNALNAMAAMSGFEDWNAMAESFSEQQGTLPEKASNIYKMPTVLDIDFSKVSLIEIYGSSYSDFYLDDEVFSWLNRWNNPGNPYDTDCTVLTIVTNNGDVEEESYEVSGDDFLDYKWDPVACNFCNSEGRRLKVFEATPYDFGPGKRASDGGSDDTQDVSGPSRYKVAVYKGQNFFGAVNVTAFGQTEAEDLALDKVWDSRIDRSEAATSSWIKEDDENGPFRGFVDSEQVTGTLYLFSEAYQWILCERDKLPNSKFEIQDDEGETVFTLS